MVKLHVLWELQAVNLPDLSDNQPSGGLLKFLANMYVIYFP